MSKPPRPKQGQGGKAGRPQSEISKAAALSSRVKLVTASGGSPEVLQPPEQFIAMPTEENYYACTEPQIDALTKADKHFSLEVSLMFVGGVLGFSQNVWNVFSAAMSESGKQSSWDLIALFLFAICVAGAILSFRYFWSEKSEVANIKKKILSQKAQKMPRTDKG